MSIDLKAFAGLTQDSRRVKTGYLFAALPGHKTDGRNYIETAIAHGATAILAPTGTMLPDGAEGVTLIEDDNPRHRFAVMVADYFGAQPAYVAAVTGTNGKSSTVHFAKQLWKSQGKKAASYGTLGVHSETIEKPLSMTTPDPETLYAELADLAAAGVTHLALEASSHGLDQNRLDGLNIKAAAFTNLSHDHLDYHEDLDHYRDSKALLFSLMRNGTAILNADSKCFEHMKAVAESNGNKVLSYGCVGEDLKLVNITPTPQGQNVKLEILGKAYEVTVPLVGGFQVKNALAALGLILAEGVDDQDEYVAALEDLQGAPGRLELVAGHPKGAVYVDYAHTPAALEQVLKALRPHTAGQLICVFGCGGDRDQSKRPVMGKIATELSDRVIVTDDNPRNERPESIRQAILEEAPGAEEVADRREAIVTAINDLEGGDVLVIAGKGHEQGQIYAERTLSFDDCEEAWKAIEELNENT